MRVFYCASEAAPLIKIGGLGDVAGSLPKALKNLGVDVTVLIPHYTKIDSTKFPVEQIGQFIVPMGGGSSETVVVGRTNLSGSKVSIILLGNERYLAQGGEQAFENTISESDRFGFFSKAIAALVQSPLADQIGRPDIIHCNDWHTAMVPIFLDQSNCPVTILTIHNGLYQGINDDGFCDRFGLFPEEINSIQFDGEQRDINFLKQGILKADVVSTVSENYAKEIVTPEFCEGLCEAFASRKDALVGILNGIDYETWNPQGDQLIALYPKDLNLDELKAVKQANRSKLLSHIGLAGTDRPIFGFIGRIEPQQKGIDLIYDWLSTTQAQADKFSAVILGTGDKEWEEKLQQLGNQSPHLSVNLLFDEGLAHLMYAGCDYILVPSRFEPCGLPQMIAQHYGTPPIVHAVGGLKDTVEDGVTGFSFTDYTTKALLGKIQQATDFYQTDAYWQMAQTILDIDHSWTNSARKYQQLYDRLLTKDRNH